MVGWEEGDCVDILLLVQNCLPFEVVVDVDEDEEEELSLCYRQKGSQCQYRDVQ